MKRRTALIAIALVVLALVPVRATDDGRHGEWSNIYVFGDSLSDNGNFIYRLTAAMTAKPQRYGLTNVTDASPNATIPYQFASDYLFWDWVHPTTTAHEAWAGSVEKALNRMEKRDREERR